MRKLKHTFGKIEQQRNIDSEKSQFNQLQVLKEKSKNPKVIEKHKEE